MVESQDKGYTPRSHAEIETILDKPKELLNSYDNSFFGGWVKIGDFAYAYLGDLKYDVLKEMT